MAQVGKSARINVKPSTSSDVVKYRVRINEDGNTFDLNDPFDEVVKPAQPDGDGFVYIPISDLPKATNLDGRYDLFVTAVDDAGTESEPLEIADVDFDFVPPEAPTEGSIVEG